MGKKAAIGGGAGMVLGGPIGALYGGGIGSGMDQADAAQQIEMAKQAQAQREREQAMGFAAPSEGELDSQQMMLTQAKSANTFAIQRLDQISKQLEQINPLIGLYAQQQKDILEGKNPSVFQPIQQQMDIQRVQQENRLRQGMGRGYGTSSAGMQAKALQGQSMAQARVGALSGLSGLMGNSIQGAGSLTQLGQQGLFGAQGMAGAYADSINRMKQRQIAASLGSSVTQYEGAGSVGALLSAASNQKWANTGLNLAATFAGQAMGAGGAGGATGGGGGGASAFSGGGGGMDNYSQRPGSQAASGYGRPNLGGGLNYYE